jgi:hypothetical protein
MVVFVRSFWFSIAALISPGDSLIEGFRGGMRLYLPPR